MTRLPNMLSLTRTRLTNALSARTGLSLAVCTLLAGAATVTIILSSTMLYGVFYKLYVPQLLHSAPVYFQYSANTTALVNFVPSSNYKFLSTSQAYSVSLDLDVPTSDLNRDLGSFMVDLELRDRHAHAIHLSSRPSILPYESQLVRTMRTLVRSVPLALGLIDERTRLCVRLVDDVYDKHFSPVTSAWIALSKPVQVYSAKIIIRAQFSGLRYWMYYWRVPTALVFIVVAVAWQLVLTVVAWSVLEAYANRSNVVETGAVETDVVGSDTSTSAVVERKSSSSLQPSFFGQPDRSDSEDDRVEQTVPDSTPSSHSLRRRTSRTHSDI
ncbi:hypothetical protein IWW56_002410 [Coemansia sp. RSA 2131]|nr:hypothetical protein IWW56_002410 [Coemansia sp. RSA 2131]